MPSDSPDFGSQKHANISTAPLLVLVCPPTNLRTRPCHRNLKRPPATTPGMPRALYLIALGMNLSPARVGAIPLYINESGWLPPQDATILLPAWEQALWAAWPNVEHAVVGSAYAAHYGMMAYQACALLGARNIGGALVEVGVFKGAMSMLMALAEMQNDNLTIWKNASGHGLRTLWLFDTFEGLPAPREGVDDLKSLSIWSAMVAVRNGSATVDQKKAVEKRVNAGLMEHPTKDGPLRWDYGSQALVRANMLSTGYPETHLRFVKGRVEQTLSSKTRSAYGQQHDLPERIAMLRLDTDFYDSTRIELEVLWPRLVSGGLLIVDDYYAWGGARQAVDEWLTLHKNAGKKWAEDALTHLPPQLWHPTKMRVFYLWKQASY